MSEENLPITGKNAVPIVNRRSINISEFFKKRFTNYFVQEAKKKLKKDV